MENGVNKVKLNLQQFGGRGASSMAGIPKNKRKSIKTYEQRIKEHKQKIKDAVKSNSERDKQNINHWKIEIRALEGNIDKILRRYKK